MERPTGSTSIFWPCISLRRQSQLKLWTNIIMLWESTPVGNSIPISRNSMTDILSKSSFVPLAEYPRTLLPTDSMTTGITDGLTCISTVTNLNDPSFELYYTQRQCLPCSIGQRIGITIYIKKVPYFACTGCAIMQPTYGATWRHDAKVPEWCTIKDKVVQACFDSPPHPSLHADPDAQSRERVCKSCFIKVRAIFADQSRGCMCVRCTGQSASVIMSSEADVS